MNSLAMLMAMVTLGTANAGPIDYIRGSYEMVVCMADGNLNVRDDSLKKILFSVPNFEPVKLFQGWGAQRKVVNGIPYVKGQFSNAQNVGWIAENLVKAKSQCPGFPSAPTPEVADDFTGLQDPRCCQFPTKLEPTADYNSGMRRFGARRNDGNRLHAACDLYRTLGEPINAVAPGLVIRDKYFFYQGTYALEVRHSGGFVVRYGEVTGRSVASVGLGTRVKMGDTIGYMGKVNSNCCEPMLHFELYSGAKTGALTASGPYQRRADLLNPTEYLKRWEDNTFRNWK